MLYIIYVFDLILTSVLRCVFCLRIYEFDLFFVVCRHVFRHFHMNCMPATLNFKCIFLAFAYLWPLLCVCSIDVVVS